MEPTKNVVDKALWYANVLQHKSTMKPEKLEQSYKQWQNQRAEFATLSHDFSLEYLKKQPLLNYPQMDKPGLLITFHFGPYRLLPRLLITAGHKVALVASSNIIQREHAWYNKEIQRSDMDNDTLTCIDASNPNCLRSILNALLKEKRSVILFIDADEGLGEGDYNKIQLFQGFVYWRTNIFKLAERFNIQIRTAYVDVESSPLKTIPKIIFGKAVKGKYGESLETVSADFHRIMRNWTAWENWCLLHKYDKSVSATKALDLSKPIWMMPCIFGGKRYFLDILNRQFFELR